NTFAAAGTYQVVLKVTDDLGQTGTTTLPVPVGSIGSPPPPTAAFVFSPSQPALGDIVSFDARTSTAAPGHSITQYKWTWGDTSLGQPYVSNMPFATHVYSQL